MVLTLLGLTTTCLIATYFFIFRKKDNSKTEVLEIRPGQKIEDVKKVFNEEELKKEFLVLFRELYRSFSTGKLSYISSKVSVDLLKSLEQSVGSRDEENFEHKFSGEPSCIIHDISIDNNNVVSVRTEFRSEQVISVPDMEDITDNVIDFFTFQKSLNQKGESWKLVQMG